MINAESYLNSIIAGSGGSGEGGNTQNPPEVEIPGGSEALEKGAISFTDLKWSNEKASVTISTNTSYTMQYQVVAEEGASNDSNWQALPQGGVIGNLNHRDVVYARLVQGTNYGEEASTTIKDENAPQLATINLNNTNVTTGTNVTAAVTHIDNESGPNITQCKYIWNTSNEKLGTEASLYTEGTFSSNGQQISKTMSTAGIWYLHVLTVDKAGNKTETVSKGVTVDTPGKPIASILKAGDYVTYPSSQGNLECRVLYDNSSGYGVQLITSNCTESSLSLGSSTFQDSISSYNNAVSTLNNAAGTYNNNTYSYRARCVGSNPSSTLDSPGYYSSTNEWMRNWNGIFKNGDTNYFSDFSQMTSLGICNIGKEYWLASRSVSDWSTGGTYFFVTNVTDSGTYNHDSSYGYLCSINFSLETWSQQKRLGLRPVFVMQSTIKVTGGSGTSTLPYTLGI